MIEKRSRIAEPEPESIRLNRGNSKSCMECQILQELNRLSLFKNMIPHPLDLFLQVPLHQFQFKGLIKFGECVGKIQGEDKLPARTAYPVAFGKGPLQVLYIVHPVI